MTKQTKTILVTLLAFTVYFIIDETYFKTLRTWFNGYVQQLGVSHILAYAVVGIPVLAGLWLLHGRGKIAESLGLSRSLIRGILFALLCTLPMFLGYAILFDFNSELSLNTFLISVIAASFFEELYFRGFLFGQIYRYTGWGFLPSVLLGAVLFGLIHLSQGAGLGELTGIFLVTFLGGILYAWVFVEWNYNLWVPIFLHLFMNLAWAVFSAGDNALGGVYANVFRVITIAMIIVLTLIYNKRNNLKTEVNRRTVWMKKE